MKKQFKAFPKTVNPIYIDKKNWECKKTKQIKKKISMSGNHNEVCIWHGQPNTKQIIRKKSLESGKVSLLPRSEELESPHSNYLIDSKQVHWLLEHIHCDCGKKKKLIDLKTIFGSFREILCCKECPLNNWEDSVINFEFSQQIGNETSEKILRKDKLAKGKLFLPYWLGTFMRIIGNILKC
ncbi:hypothetical protein M0812_29652 [Anaeramoeba flamelloides]|uniref:Uncharacterized protein n=1 Tax=Anaeramoeba flamelloides TaxID=1746091 RepID=A0AAV7Y5X5_9EUKA|nr:hypothetical protein M0812_29652 [Anaeramoeba flamelloides]